MISCIVMSDGLLKDDEEFPDEEDEYQFEQLHQLYTGNSTITADFALYVN